ncbi:MAG: glycerophosphodiester phosphodiesterase family protein [Bacteroidota bacterium]
MRNFFLQILFILFISSRICSQSQTIWQALDSKTNKVLVAAHRGDSKNFPENSLPAIQSCIDRGIDIVEIDVQRTKDGHFVLMHDQTVRRTTNGKGRVSRYLLKDVIKLRLKDKKGKLTEHCVPTLDTVLKLIKGKIIVNLDKSSGLFNELTPIVNKYNCGPYVILKGGGDAVSFCEWSNQFPNGPLFMPVKNGRKTNIDTFAIDSKARLMEVLIRTDTDYICWPKVLQTLKYKNCNIWYNALFDAISGKHTESKDAINSWNWFVNHDAKVIQTDYPFELLQYLINNNLHEIPHGFISVSLNHLPEKKGKADTSALKNNLDEEKEITSEIEKENLHPIKKKSVQKKSEIGVKKYHRVKTGDTFNSIATKYNISLARIYELNPAAKKKKVLKNGIKIRVM